MSGDLLQEWGVWSWQKASHVLQFHLSQSITFAFCASISHLHPAAWRGWEGTRGSEREQQCGLESLSGSTELGSTVPKPWQYTYRYAHFLLKVSQGREHGEYGCTHCCCLGCVFCSGDLHTQSLLCVIGVCGCVSAGSMCSVSLLAEWGNMELEQTFLSQATRLSNN